ncbi:hypothetical protein GLYMA_18G221500v4 [Glycine max]|nr:hypothetical protein GLYMA_18G221500v4 [Glycine max]KAH1155625.1 hypothetical protein GYH30_050763 [Glycine max]
MQSLHGGTQIVEIAHYNMNRIRLVWSSIWHVLSDFFVTIGCSGNLSIAIFAMDSLRQLSMKFLEREELANYNFQNEFMKPFVIVMRKSSAVEIRELIIRCVSNGFIPCQQCKIRMEEHCSWHSQQQHMMTTKTLYSWLLKLWRRLFEITFLTSLRLKPPPLQIV